MKNNFQNMNLIGKVSCMRQMEVSSLFNSNMGVQMEHVLEDMPKEIKQKKNNDIVYFYCFYQIKI